MILSEKSATFRDHALARHRASDNETCARTVLPWMEGHRHDIARPKRIGVDARRDQLRRCAQFERPQHRLARPLVSGHDAKPGMRIDPLECLHRALLGERLVGVVHGEGMMCQRGHGKGGCRDGGQGGKPQVHGRLSISPMIGVTGVTG